VLDVPTSNTSVALGGTFGGLPAEPYAYSGLQSIRHTSPFCMEHTAISHALMTWPVWRHYLWIHYYCECFAII